MQIHANQGFIQRGGGGEREDIPPPPPPPSLRWPTYYEDFFVVFVGVSISLCAVSEVRAVILVVFKIFLFFSSLSFIYLFF